MLHLSYSDRGTSMHCFARFFAVAALISTAPPAVFAAATCADEAATKSPSEKTPTNVTFHNPTSGKLRLYWIDLDGRRKFYAIIDPGQSVKQQTYVGHNWVVTNDAEACLFVIQASAAPITVELGNASSNPPARSTDASPAGEVSPVERYHLEGRYRLVSRSDNRRSINAKENGSPELVATQPQGGTSQWEFEAVPGSALVWIKNIGSHDYLLDDDGKLRVMRTLPDDPNGQWAMETVDGEAAVRIKSQGSGRYLIAGRNEDIFLDTRRSTSRDGEWLFVPVASPSPVADEPARRRDKDDDDGYASNKARAAARASCDETGGYWTGRTCKISKVSKRGHCKEGTAWSEDAGRCQYDGGPRVKNVERGDCGPGYIAVGKKCVNQATRKADPPAPKVSEKQNLQNKINQNTEQLNALVKKCPKGQVWNQAEGCHEDD